MLLDIPEIIIKFAVLSNLPHYVYSSEASHACGKMTSKNYATWQSSSDMPVQNPKEELFTDRRHQKAGYVVVSLQHVIGAKYYPSDCCSKIRSRSPHLVIDKRMK